MMGKIGNTIQKICMIGIVMSVIMVMVGCSGKMGNQKVEKWDGAKADLENGLRVKEAVYNYSGTPYKMFSSNDPRKFSITYDMEGRITSVTKSSPADELPDALKSVLDLDGAIYYISINYDTGEVEKIFLIMRTENKMQICENSIENMIE